MWLSVRTGGIHGAFCATFALDIHALQLAGYQRRNGSGPRALPEGHLQRHTLQLALSFISGRERERECARARTAAPTQPTDGPLTGFSERVGNPRRRGPRADRNRAHQRQLHGRGCGLRAAPPGAQSFVDLTTNSQSGCDTCGEVRRAHDIAARVSALRVACSPPSLFRAHRLDVMARCNTLSHTCVDGVLRVG